ncbi:MAG: hypothetical protein OSJ67_04240 [Clostridia bacterium]|nr:hypothetical protein [Clostridia bacterium]
MNRKEVTLILRLRLSGIFETDLEATKKALPRSKKERQYDNERR